MDTWGLILPARIIGAIFLVIALANVSIGGFWYRANARFVDEAVKTTGTVIEQRPSSGENGTTYATVFEFVDQRGETRRAESSWSSNPPAHAVGERVEVLYTAANPADACVRSFASLWLGPAIFGGLALVPLVVGCVMVWLIPLTIRRVWPRPVAA